MILRAVVLRQGCSHGRSLFSLPASTSTRPNTHQQVRRGSSLHRLLFEREHEDTRPLVPRAVLSLVDTEANASDRIKLSLDGNRHDFPYVYLRDTCQCAKCVDPSTTQKSFNTGDVSADVKPAALRVVKNALEIIWNDEHRSVFPAELLSSYVDRPMATQTRHNAREPIVWDAASIATKDLSTSYKSYMSSEASVFDVVKNLADYGLAFLQNCPSGAEAETQLQTLVERIGPLKTTFYGPTWNVKAVESAKNVAYTSVDLDLHMDLLYYESPPGLQFLHCLENEVEGGSSIFVDSFKIAEVMRREHPKAFEVLCTHPVDFKYDNDGVYYHQSRPTFVLNAETSHLEYVNYSPPFQGIQVPTGFAAYHEAISIFAKLLASDQYRYELILKPGQCVIFNNRRTLHARRSFGPGRRWLKGAYADIDTLWSKYRTGQAQISS